jgi:hypothetical protein
VVISTCWGRLTRPPPSPRIISLDVGPSRTSRTISHREISLLLVSN